MREPEAEVENRTSGRYRLNDHDKAKPVPLKLHQKYIDRLEWLPGKNNAEKIRNMIDGHCEFIERERRQIGEIKRLIGPLYRLAKDLTDPALVQNKAKFNSEKMRFLTGVKSLQNLIDLYHFSFETLKKGLSERDFIELEIIFSAKNHYLGDF